MRNLKTYDSYESDISLLINNYLSNLIDSGYPYIIEGIDKNHYRFRLRPDDFKSIIQWRYIKYDILPFLEIFRNEYDIVEIENDDGESEGGNIGFRTGRYYNFYNLDEFIKIYNIDSSLNYNFYELYFEFRRKK